MSFEYNLETLKEALKFNSVEVLPSDEEKLDEELKVLVEEANKSGQRIRHYIGFEISGKIHIGTGIASALKMKKLQDAGVKCSLWLADYHTWLNNKLDGTMETIRKASREYFAPVMKECLAVVGCDVDDIDILFAEDEYEKKVNDQSFWTFDMKVAKELTLNRVLKSISITGKDAGGDVNFGILRYPPMQVADAYFMQTHIVHAGMDQRKCHVLMREVATKLDDQTALKIGDKSVKPIAMHHKLLASLEPPKGDDEAANKMSKSRPDSAVWVHDSEEDIVRKLKKAYCPMPQETQSKEEIEAEQESNPVLDWCKNMIYPAGQIVAVERPEKFGGNKSYNTYEELEKDYFESNLHPMDLKVGVAKSLANWFEPIRKWTDKNQEIMDFLDNVRK